MLLLTSDCSGYLVILPAPLIRCLCVDFVRVTLLFLRLRLRGLCVCSSCRRVRESTIGVGRLTGGISCWCRLMCKCVLNDSGGRHDNESDSVTVTVSLWQCRCHRVTVTVSPSPCHRDSVIVTVSPWQCHRHRVTVTVSPSPCHRDSVIVTVSPWQCHRHRVTVTVSPSPCHRDSVTVTVSPWQCQCHRSNRISNENDNLIIFIYQYMVSK